MEPQIDPRDFGRLEGEVAALRRESVEMGRTIDKMADQLDRLTELANQSKGGLWAGMALASSLGGIATWLASHFQFLPR